MDKSEIKEELLLNFMLQGMNLEQNGLMDTIEDLVSMQEKTTEAEVRQCHQELLDTRGYHKFRIKVNRIAKDMTAVYEEEWLIMSSDGEDGFGVGDLLLFRIGEPDEEDFSWWVALEWGVGEDEQKWIKGRSPEGEVVIFTGYEIFRFKGEWDERQCEELEYKDIPNKLYDND